MDLDDENTFCKEAQLTSAMLFDGAEFAETSTVKKGLVLELLHIQKSAKAPWSQFTQWLESLFHTQNVSINAVRKAVTHLHEKKLKIQKDPARKSEVNQLLQEPFSLPQSQECTLPRMTEPAVRKKRSPLQPVVVQQALSTVNRELASELEQAKAECIKKDQQLEHAQRKLSEYNPHNIRRRLNRRDIKIAQQKENIKQLEKDIKLAQKVGAKQAQSQLRYHKMKHIALQLKEDTPCESCIELEAENERLKQEIIELKDANAHLMDCVRSHEPTKLETYKDGKYTDEVRMCVMELSSRNVGIMQIEPVVRSVLKLCKVDCEWFPKHTQINEMIIESRSLAHVQLADVLTHCENNTLHSDGTSKFGHKYTSFQATTTEGSYSLGIQVCLKNSLFPVSSK